MVRAVVVSLKVNEITPLTNHAYTCIDQMTERTRVALSDVKKSREEAIEDASMSEDADIARTVRIVGHIVEGRVDALEDLAPRFAASNLHIGGAAAERLDLLGKELGDLGLCEPLPPADIDLAKARVLCDGAPQRERRIARALKVRTDDVVKTLFAEPCRERLGLFAAESGEGRVTMPLPPAANICFGLPVTHEMKSFHVMSIARLLARVLLMRDDHLIDETKRRCGFSAHEIVAFGCLGDFINGFAGMARHDRIESLA